MKIDHSTIGISIVICCHNSASRIKPTLEHIALQQVPSTISWEIILVDNNSSDKTTEKALEIWEKLSIAKPLKICKESQIGLANARKKGLLASNYAYILYCDDDNWLNKNYTRLAYELMESNPDIGMLGGRGIAISDKELPFWFNTFQSAYAVGVQALNSGPFEKPGSVWGAGMIIRKNIYQKVLESGFTSLTVGRKGNVLSAGEDTEIGRLFLLAGYRVYYDERLVFQHFIEQKRLTKTYYQKLTKGFREARKKINIYDSVLYNQRYNKSQKMAKFFYTFLKYLFLRLTSSKEIEEVYTELAVLSPIGILFNNKEINKVKKIAQFLKKNKSQ